MGADAVTAINTSKGIVVIDAGISYSLTKQYRKQFEKVFSKTYCALLINTHGHPDHTGGNLVFNDAEIVAHVNCIKEMQEQIKNPENVSKNLLKTIESYNNQLKMVDSSSVDWCDAYCQKARYFSAYNDLLEKKQLNFPGLTFTDSLFISMGDVSFDMIYFGKAHSESDILIYVPELKLLFSGDIFTKYGKHHICNADKQLSLRRGHVKKWLQKRKHKIEKIIGGHGEIMSKDDMDAFCKNLVMHEKNPFLYNNIM
ncbi:MAG: hypothetical protein A2275_14510 [Bacteroidetes bacterium RIFOXYA12_FULL_35_11]|nr:MAG: hypothetical protein A2X01_08695 [Bacteroidetes bacterium GWF2_35_48]OFY74736.1 MAG: hypothetical protein A2275_14510 [Bacteroidetes bacterium RIFOXYA12_FULL_35_11]OFY92845.1 MAG: hypothetical protein A2309_11480 [Bacteroidetes bacterium RIFOXYB2_FULL_35_7]OFY98924.1 MAG: hypothetical protein A2491_01980 [Bacteroidetes bacterium RIFOXYC12_FULL_35_7]